MILFQLKMKRNILKISVDKIIFICMLNPKMLQFSVICLAKFYQKNSFLTTNYAKKFYVFKSLFTAFSWRIFLKIFNRIIQFYSSCEFSCKQENVISVSICIEIFSSTSSSLLQVSKNFIFSKSLDKLSFRNETCHFAKI